MTDSIVLDEREETTRFGLPVFIVLLVIGLLFWSVVGSIASLAHGGRLIFALVVFLVIGLIIWYCLK